MISFQPLSSARTPCTAGQAAQSPPLRSGALPGMAAIPHTLTPSTPIPAGATERAPARGSRPLRAARAGGTRSEDTEGMPVSRGTPARHQPREGAVHTWEAMLLRKEPAAMATPPGGSSKADPYPPRPSPFRPPRGGLGRTILRLQGEEEAIGCAGGGGIARRSAEGAVPLLREKGGQRRGDAQGGGGASGARVRGNSSSSCCCCCCCCSPVPVGAGRHEHVLRLQGEERERVEGLPRGAARPVGAGPAAPGSDASRACSSSHLFPPLPFPPPSWCPGSRLPCSATRPFPKLCWFLIPARPRFAQGAVFPQRGPTGSRRFLGWKRATRTMESSAYPCTGQS